MTARTLPDVAGTYQIEVQGNLDPTWSDWFDGFSAVPQADGRTLLVGQVIDQSALHGLLTKIRDLGLPLLSLKRVEKERRGER
jgi:hypothetical protein